jgi:D-aminoacyl-tRNA deacylase
MRAVIQRATRATVVCGDYTASIAHGLVIFLGVESLDHVDDVHWLAGKIARLRIFSDIHGKMNRSVSDVDGSLMLISQFTLYASTHKGNRPSFQRAAPPAEAETLYRAFARALVRESGCRVQTGIFGGDMTVDLVNDGPVTIVMDSRSRE